MESKCKNCEEKTSCIPFFIHENAMMHKDADNRRMMTVNIALCVTLVIVVVTLVSFYTSRTAMWNDTVTKLTSTLAEVTNGVYKQSDP